MSKSFRIFISFLIHLIESKAKKKRDEKKICRFQEGCKKKEDCKFPHVPTELLKDLRPPIIFAINSRIATGKTVHTFTGSQLIHLELSRAS